MHGCSGTTALSQTLCGNGFKTSSTTFHYVIIKWFFLWRYNLKSWHWQKHNFQKWGSRDDWAQQWVWLFKTETKSRKYLFWKFTTHLMHILVFRRTTPVPFTFYCTTLYYNIRGRKWDRFSTQFTHNNFDLLCMCPTHCRPCCLTGCR